jgi:hypothetical protein
LYTMCKHVKSIEISEFGYERATQGANGAKSASCMVKMKANMAPPYRAALKAAATSSRAATNLRELNDAWLKALQDLAWRSGESDAAYKSRTMQPYQDFTARIAAVRTSMQQTQTAKGKAPVNVAANTAPKAAAPKPATSRPAAKTPAEAAPPATASAATDAAPAAAPAQAAVVDTAAIEPAATPDTAATADSVPMEGSEQVAILDVVAAADPVTALDPMATTDPATAPDAATAAAPPAAPAPDTAAHKAGFAIAHPMFGLRLPFPSPFSWVLPAQWTPGAPR